MEVDCIFFVFSIYIARKYMLIIIKLYMHPLVSAVQDTQIHDTLAKDLSCQEFSTT